MRDYKYRGNPLVDTFIKVIANMPYEIDDAVVFENENKTII